MSKIRKYNDFLFEAVDDKYSEVVEAIKDMIKSTIDKSGGEFKQFIESFLQNPEDVKILGLINDADVYEFYLKYRNQIDELLNEINYFSEVPSDNNIYGLYDFTIQGTLKSVIEFVKLID